MNQLKHLIVDKNELNDWTLNLNYLSCDKYVYLCLMDFADTYIVYHKIFADVPAVPH